jgi:hypothetical protein
MSESRTLTLADFLLARVAEDEASADELHWDACEHHYGREIGGFPCDCWYPERVRRECDAKRRIVELHAPVEVYRGRPLVCTVCVQVDDGGDYVIGAPGDVWPCTTLRALASVFADHPDYREEWRP